MALVKILHKVKESLLIMVNFSSYRKSCQADCASGAPSQAGVWRRLAASQCARQPAKPEPPAQSQPPRHLHLRSASGCSTRTNRQPLDDQHLYHVNNDQHHDDNNDDHRGSPDRPNGRLGGGQQHRQQQGGQLEFCHQLHADQQRHGFRPQRAPRHPETLPAVHAHRRHVLGAEQQCLPSAPISLHPVDHHDDVDHNGGSREGVHPAGERFHAG
jgi:hypothetical protein